MKITQHPSPNFNDRRAPIDMLVLHYTGMETGGAALDRMCDPAAEVSAHYMIWETGRIVQLVAEDKRAWHAGIGSWQGDTELNSHAIGIEIVNGGHDFPLADGRLPPYPDIQIDAVVALSKAIVERHAIPPSRIVGHSDIAPDRKTDPGEHFPWGKLASRGLGLWPNPPKGDELMGAGLTAGESGPAVSRLQEALRDIGYGLPRTGVFDTATQRVVTAFQRRWVQDRVNGQAGWLTLARIGAVAAEVREEMVSRK